MPKGIKGFQKGHHSKTEFKKGHTPWSKDLTKETDLRVKKISEANKRKHLSPGTEFKKGRISVNKGKTEEKASNWKGEKGWFEKKLKNYVRIRANDKCENPYCNDGNPQKHCINLDTHHINPKDDSFWMRIYLCDSCHKIAEDNLRINSNTNLRYWNTIFLQTLKKKHIVVEKYIEKTGKIPPEFKELLNHTNFLEHYQKQKFSPIFKESTMKKFTNIKKI